MPKKAPKKKTEEKPKVVAKRAREMPMTDKQAEAAIQALRNDAGSAAYRKRLQENKSKGEESVKKKEMNMGRQATMGGRQNLANEETNRPNFGKDTTNFQYRNAKPPGMSAGGKAGKIRGYGMARGGKACKMM